MPLDPREYRVRAADCKILARSATTKPARLAFLDLAQAWERIADELEGTERFLQAMSAIEPTKHCEPEGTGLSLHDGKSRGLNS